MLAQMYRFLTHVRNMDRRPRVLEIEMAATILAPKSCSAEGHQIFSVRAAQNKKQGEVLWSGGRGGAKGS